MNYKVGDVLLINYWGHIYTTYDYMAQKLNLKKYKNGYHPYKNSPDFYTDKTHRCKILSIQPDDTTTSEYLLGVRILELDKDVILAGDKEYEKETFSLPEHLFKL